MYCFSSTWSLTPLLDPKMSLLEVSMSMTSEWSSTSTSPTIPRLTSTASAVPAAPERRVRFCNRRTCIIDRGIAPNLTIRLSLLSDLRRRRLVLRRREERPHGQGHHRDPEQDEPERAPRAPRRGDVEPRRRRRPWRRARSRQVVDGGAFLRSENPRGVMRRSLRRAESPCRRSSSFLRMAVASLSERTPSGACT